MAGIEFSGLVQKRKSAIHGLPVKPSKSDLLRMRNEYSAHAKKIGSGQSSRSLPQARRVVGSGDTNDRRLLAFFLTKGIPIHERIAELYAFNYPFGRNMQLKTLSNKHKLNFTLMIWIKNADTRLAYMTFIKNQ